MTDYERDIEAKVLTMRDLAKNTNSTQATEILTKLVSSYPKYIIADMLEYYNAPAPLQATKSMLVNKLVRHLVTEAVLSKVCWKRWILKMMAM